MNKKEIDNLISTSLKSGEKEKANVYRLIKAEFLKAEKEHGIEPDEDKCMKIIYKMMEQRKDSIEQYTKGGRKDLADIEQGELEILQELVPKIPSEEEINKEVEYQVDLFKTTFGSVSMKDTKALIDVCSRTLLNVPNLGRYVSMSIKKYM